MRRLTLNINITPGDPAEVADGDEDGHADGALGGGGQVVGDPADDLDEGGIEADGDGEEEAVGQAGEPGLRDRELGDEAEDGDGVAGDDEGAAGLDFLGPGGD